MYSNEDRNDMLFCYYASDRNSDRASNMYFERYPERRQPDKRLFSNLETNLKKYGSFTKPKDVKIKFKREDEERVLAYNIFKPNSSIREIASECNVSKEKARLILKQNALRPYKPHIGNTFYPGDAERRLQFVRWFLQETGNNPNFPETIFFYGRITIYQQGYF